MHTHTPLSLVSTEGSVTSTLKFCTLLDLMASSDSSFSKEDTTLSMALHCMHTHRGDMTHTSVMTTSDKPYTEVT